MDDSAIIITGGAQRIGYHMAQTLKETGHNVIVTYRTLKDGVDKLKQYGVDCRQVDLTNPDELSSFISDIRSQYSSLRAIIHNASSWLPEKPNHNHSDTLNENFQIHVDVPYILNLELEPLLLHYNKQSQKLADVIHMTDYVVERGSNKHIAYSASKAALANMTLSFANKWAPFVKVNNIAPALLMFNEDDNDDYKIKASKKSLLKAAPGPQEATDILLTIMKSQYITGRTFSLDGGRHLKN